MKTFQEIMADPINAILGILAIVILSGLFEYLFKIMPVKDGFSLRDLLGSLLKTLPGWIWQNKTNSVALVLIAILIGFLWGFNSSENETAIGFKVPISEWMVEADLVGNVITNSDEYIVGKYALTSTQDNNGYPIPNKTVTYNLEYPANLDRLGNAPMRGIISNIKVIPSHTTDYSEYVYCHYSVKYNEQVYTSTEQHVPYNQWTTLVWDFTGRIWDLPDAPDDDSEYFEKVDNIFTSGGLGFSYFFRRLDELWQTQHLAYGNYSAGSIQRLSVTCNVSASRELRGGNEGDTFTFEGKFSFGDAYLIPYIDSVE